jgi:hypothetical protein
MTHHSQADVSTTISILSALITISSIQPFVSLCAGLIAIISGLLAARFYYWKTKYLKQDKDANS